MGGGGNPIVEDPSSDVERKSVAEVCMTKLDLEPMPALIDGVDDAVNQAYGAWPDRLYLIDFEGNVAYQGGPGPFGFEPDELEAALRVELGMPELPPESDG